jgi:hypothetical protein
MDYRWKKGLWAGESEEGQLRGWSPTRRGKWFNEKSNQGRGWLQETIAASSICSELPTRWDEKGERVWTRLGRAESVEEEAALQSNVGIKQSEDHGELDPWMLCFFHFLPTPALGPNLQPGII